MSNMMACMVCGFVCLCMCQRVCHTHVDVWSLSCECHCTCWHLGAPAAVMCQCVAQACSAATYCRVGHCTSVAVSHALPGGRIGVLAVLLLLQGQHTHTHSSLDAAGGSSAGDALGDDTAESASETCCWPSRLFDLQGKTLLGLSWMPTAWARCTAWPANGT